MHSRLLLPLLLFLTLVSQSWAKYPPMDTALVTVVSHRPESSLELLGSRRDCHKCLKLPLAELKPNVPQVIRLTTVVPYDFVIRSATHSHLLIFSHRFGEWGEYRLEIEGSAIPHHTVTQTKAPIFTLLPAIIALIVFTVLASAACAFRWIRYCIKQRKEKAEGPSELDSLFPATNLMPGLSAPAPVAKDRPQRLRSLDCFRGMCLTVMIFVNYGAGGYYFFDHAPWNGALHLADLVFPWFVFIMGAAVPLSQHALRSKGISTPRLAFKIVKRAVILYALGLFLNNGRHVFMDGRWRVVGVLQRFSVSYLAVALIVLLVPPRGVAEAVGCCSALPCVEGRGKPPTRYSELTPPPALTLEHGTLSTAAPEPAHRLAFLRDLVPYWLQWSVVSGLLLIFFLITYLLPVPGCPRGYLGPGGLHDGGKYFNCTGGAAGYIDRKLLGPKCMYLYPTCKEVYHTGAFDPEGILGFLPSIVLCFLGVHMGRIFLTFSKPAARIVRLTLWGLVWGALGALLCGASVEGGPIPLNKNLWSPSYICVMAGTGYLAVMLCYVLLDVTPLWTGAPFTFVGMNSILLFCAHGIMGHYFPFTFNCPTTHAFLLTRNLLGVSSWVVIAYVLHRKKMYLKI